MNSVDFSSWLQNELNVKGWRPTDLARRSRISDAAISRILRGERNADANTLVKIAEALNISPIVLFRHAGLLPPGGEKVTFEDWQHLIEQLDPADEAELHQIAEMKIERRKKEKELKMLKPRKVG